MRYTGLKYCTLWSCRESNPGPDKETVALSTCLVAVGFSSKSRSAPDLLIYLRCLVSRLRHTFAIAIQAFSMPRTQPRFGVAAAGQ